MLNMENIPDKPCTMLSSFREGEFVQTRYRDYDNHNPPPIFYVGKSLENDKVSLLSLHNYKWQPFSHTHLVCKIRPTLSAEQRASIIPYLEDEPAYTMIGVDYGSAESRTFAADMVIMDDPLADEASKQFNSIITSYRYGTARIASTPVADVIRAV